LRFDYVFDYVARRFSLIERDSATRVSQKGGLTAPGNALHFVTSERDRTPVEKTVSQKAFGIPAP
jgi:hypothetical protein